MIVNRIDRAILLIRGEKVMLDSDLASIYGVTTKRLNEQVKRNLGRFPADFMFQLTRQEHRSLRYQFGTLRWGEHAKYLPYAFTQEGALMLANVLNSDEAIEAVQVARALFVRLRRLLTSTPNLPESSMLWKESTTFNSVLFDAIRELMAPPDVTGKEIGFERKERRSEVIEVSGRARKSPGLDGSPVVIGCFAGISSYFSIRTPSSVKILFTMPRRRPNRQRESKLKSFFGFLGLFKTKSNDRFDQQLGNLAAGATVLSKGIPSFS